jgi:hypothetical protein
MALPRSLAYCEGLDDVQTFRDAEAQPGETGVPATMSSSIRRIRSSRSSLASNVPGMAAHASKDTTDRGGKHHNPAAQNRCRWGTLKADR